MVKLGSHVSMSGKKMLLGSSEEAASYGANTFMIYTGAPQNTRRKPIEELNIENDQKHMDEHDMNDIVVHAPYIINIANKIKPATFQLGIDFLQNEIERTSVIGAKQIIEGLNELLLKEQDVQIALETMAGKGTEIGRSFDEIAKIIDGVTHNEHLSVCLDTCHINDAGYDVTGDFDKVLTEFDKIIGLDRIIVLYFNGSMNNHKSQ